MHKECGDTKGKINRCYRSFYKIAITPSKSGDAIVATCWNNIFRPENRVVVRRNIKDVWNSRQFRFQRKLIAKNDWSFCRGACCSFDPFCREAPSSDSADVRNAIAQRRDILDYPPKIVAIIPSHVCNSNCYSCYQAFMRNDRKKYCLKEDLLQEIKEAIIPGAEVVIISGGEPFFAKQTREFTGRITSDHPYIKVAINTNGSLIHEYGVDKIIEGNIFLTITVYGMEDRTYEEVTGRNNRDIVFRNIQELIDRHYKRMQVVFLLTSRSFKDSEKFCEFIAKNEFVDAVVRNNWYEGKRFWKLMHRLEEKYANISSRLRFEYQNEPLLKAVCRRWYNPIYSLRYLLENWKD